MWKKIVALNSAGTNPTVFGFGSLFYKVRPFDVRFWERSSCFDRSVQTQVREVSKFDQCNFVLFEVRHFWFVPPLITTDPSVAR